MVYQYNLINRNRGLETTAKWAANAIKDIYSMLNVEVKTNDQYQTAANVTSTAVFYELTDIDTGITGSSSADGILDKGYREGDKIRVKQIHIRGAITNNSSNTNINNVQLLLVKHYDNMLNGAVSYNDLYDSATGGVFYTKLRNLDHTKTYKILARTTIELLTGTVDENCEKHFTIHKKITKRAGSYVEWSGGSGLDPSNGKYYLVAISDQTTNPPALEFSSRVSFIDN